MPTYSSDGSLFQVQIGKETTLGTPVAGALKLMDVTKCDLKPEMKSDPRKYLRGSLAPTYKTVIKEIGATAKIETDLNYSDLPYWLEALFAIATPSGVGPYVRAYTAPLGAKVSPRMMTILKGDADGTYKMTSAIGQKLVIKGNSTGAWSASIDLFGYDVTVGTLAALSDRTVTPIMGSDTLLYLDTWAGTIGATEVTGSQFDFELTIDTKRAPKRHMTLKPDGYKQPEWNAQLKLTFEYDATTQGYLSALLAQTATSLYQKQIRIKATSGTSIAQIDFAGTADDAPTIFTDTDGIATVELTLNAEYNSTLTNYLLASITNSVASLV